MADPSDFAYTPPSQRRAYEPDVMSNPKNWPSGEPYPGPTASNIGAADSLGDVSGLIQESRKIGDSVQHLLNRVRNR